MTNVSMIVVSVDWSKLCFTRPIWPSFEIHDDDNACICLSYVRCESRCIPRSLTSNTGIRFLPIKLIWTGDSNWFMSFRVPTTNADPFTKTIIVILRVKFLIYYLNLYITSTILDIPDLSHFLKPELNAIMIVFCHIAYANGTRFNLLGFYWLVYQFVNYSNPTL